MLAWDVRLWLWLLMVCVPAQAGMAMALRTQGPAHVHVGSPLAARSMVEPPASKAAWHTVADGHAQAHPTAHADAHADAHARSHGQSRAAHHEHDPADASVVLIADADDEPGAGSGTGKASVIDLPGLLTAAPACAMTAAGRSLDKLPSPAFASLAPVPLYRPPR